MASLRGPTRDVSRPKAVAARRFDERRQRRSRIRQDLPQPPADIRWLNGAAAAREIGFEVLCHFVGGGVAFIDVSGHRLGDDVIQTSIDVAKEGRRGRDRPALNGAARVGLALPPEEAQPRQ